MYSNPNSHEAGPVQTNRDFSVTAWVWRCKVKANKYPSSIFSSWCQEDNQEAEWVSVKDHHLPEGAACSSTSAPSPPPPALDGYQYPQDGGGVICAEKLTALNLFLSVLTQP